MEIELVGLLVEQIPLASFYMPRIEPDAYVLRNQKLNRLLGIGPEPWQLSEFAALSDVDPSVAVGDFFASGGAVGHGRIDVYTGAAGVLRCLDIVAFRLDGGSCFGCVTAARA